MRRSPHPSRSFPAALAWLAALGACAGPDQTLVGPEPALATSRPPDVARLAQSQGFRDRITAAGIREHQAAFQTIATASGGTRATGTAGFDATVQYVVGRMTAAGYDVTVQEFPVTLLGDRTPPVLLQVSPMQKTYVAGEDFRTMSYSGSGDVTAPVVAVDLVVPSPGLNTSTSGCQAADFAGFPAGSIALVQRGTCTFRVKAENALAAGAAGVIIFNEGTLGRTDILNGTLGAPQLSLPVVGTSFAVGIELRGIASNSGPTGVTVRLKVDAVAEVGTGRNVIAESRVGDPNAVVVVGAQLDGHALGPAINAASGAATMLEIAKVFAEQERAPRNRLRFVWFGGHAQGLVGSTYHVDALSPAERARIALMLQLDPLGSPNFARFVFDGSGSPSAPPGSGAVEQLFLDYFGAVGLTTDAESVMRSDHQAFAQAGIAVGALFAGADGIKTPAQAAVYGGVPGMEYDPCHLLACDTFANNSDTALGQMSDAAAHAVLLLSKRNFAKDPLVTP